MMKYVIGLALLALSACASVPALAQGEASRNCELTWADAQERVAAYNPTIHEYAPGERQVLSNWYNNLPPATDHVFTAIYRIEASVFGQHYLGLAFVIDGCVVAHGQISPNDLERLLPQA